MLWPGELRPRVAPHRFACGFCLPGRAGWRLYLFISPTSVRVVWLFCQHMLL